MFIEEAEWLKEVIKKIQPLSNNNYVANLGSSTEHFRQTIQPHIHQHIIMPLQQNGWHITHVDIKNDEGVTVVADITSTNFPIQLNQQFALTICTNMLEHVKNIPLVISNLQAITARLGYILITVPYKYKIHLDPIDNGFRPTPKQITQLFKQDTFKVIDAAIITINNMAYYQIKKSRLPLWGYRQRLQYYLGKRHKVSGVLLQVIGK